MLWISSINPLNAWIMEIKFVGIEEQRPMLEEEDAPGDFYYYYFFQVYSFTYFWILRSS